MESLTVRLSYRKIHSRDCQDCEETEAAYIDFIQREITVGGPLTEEQRERLLWIAARCPVSKTLTSTPRIMDSIRQSSP